AACDRSIAFAEHLAADHDAATELVADALTAKIKVLVHIDENLHDCHRLVMDLHNRIAERFGAKHPVTARAQSLAAAVLLRLGNREMAAQLWTAAEESLRQAVTVLRTQSRGSLAEALLNYSLGGDSADDKLASAAAQESWRQAVSGRRTEFRESL